MDWKKHFRYSNGHLYWLDVTGSRKRGPLGSDNGRGYARINFGGAYWYAHRIIYEMHNGTIPKGMQVDHINCNRSDNRIENLQLMSNKQNSRKAAIQTLSKNNKSGVRGVRRGYKGSWRAEIVVNGKNTHLGDWPTKAQAAVARAKGEVKYFPEAFKQTR